jgi:hypothetical protein
MSLEQRDARNRRTVKAKRQKVEEAPTVAIASAEEDDEKQGASAEVEMEGNSDGQEVELQRNSDGDAFFELSSNRRISVRKFKGKTLVDIREVRGICHAAMDFRDLFTMYQC